MHSDLECEIAAFDLWFSIVVVSLGAIHMVSLGAETFQRLLHIKCNKNVLKQLKICSCA